MAEDSEITLDRLLELRTATRALSDELEKNLRGYLETISPLVRPKRLLGDLLAGESTETYPEAEQAFEELQKLFKEVGERPFRIRTILSRPIPAIRSRLEIYPWQEVWSPPEGGQRLAVVSPFAWCMSYPGGCTLRSLRRMLEGDEPRNEDEIHQFVLSCCILKLMIERTPGFGRILGGLRYTLETRHSPDLGELPIPVIASVVPSVRPPADVMVRAAALAGLGHFEEVIDPRAPELLADPLRALLDEHLAGAG